MKNIRFFLSENFQFLEVKFSKYLNRRVFVMTTLTLTASERNLTYPLLFIQSMGVRVHMLKSVSSADRF